MQSFENNNLLLFSSVEENHPAHDQVEEEHGVDCQHLPGGRIAVTQELHGGEGAPDKPSQNYDQPRM